MSKKSKITRDACLPQYEFGCKFWAKKVAKSLGGKTRVVHIKNLYYLTIH